MRVGFLTHYAALYGANRSLLNLIDGLAGHGVSSHVLCPENGDMVQELTARKVPVEVVPFHRWMRRSRRGAVLRLASNLRVLPALTRQLRDWKVDLIYSNSSVISIGALAARVVKRPHVWHLREFGDLDYDLRHDWGAPLFRKLVGRAQARIAVSRAVRTHHLDDHAGNAHVIYNGVAPLADFERNYARAAAAASDDQTFALVGKIQPKKGQLIAITALSLIARRFPRARLLIVGSPPEERYIKTCRDLALELGVTDRVEFWGYVDDPHEAFLKSSVALMCSQHEAWGRVTVEAMSMCRPVIGYRGGGTVELIEHGKTGLLYEGGAEELARCMTLLLENPRLARELGVNGWRVARDEFSQENYARQVAGVLQSVVDVAR